MSVHKLKLNAKLLCHFHLPDCILIFIEINNSFKDNLFAGGALEISACRFLYIIKGLLKGCSKGFHNSKPQNFVGPGEPIETTLTQPLICVMKTKN